MACPLSRDLRRGLEASSRGGEVDDEAPAKLLGDRPRCVPRPGELNRAAFPVGFDPIPAPPSDVSLERLHARFLCYNLRRSAAGILMNVPPETDR